MADADLVLRLQNVDKSYGRQRALIDVSLDMPAGEFLGLLGPNGAGKSTLFQLMSGLFVPDDGTIEIFGMTYSAHPSRILRNLGVVFQARSVDLDMTVRANLKFHGGLFGLYGKRLRERIEQVAPLFDLDDKLDRLVRNLSGGEQRRVEVARALLNRPGLLLMDEASAGLDTASRAALVTHMRDLSREHATAVLWATHLVDELDAADRVVVLNRGRILGTGTPEQLKEQTGAPSLTDAYTRLTGASPAEDAPSDAV